MSEQLVVIHQSALQTWAENPPPDLDPDQAVLVLEYISQVTAAADLSPVFFEGYDFATLPDLVDPQAEKVLLGARAGYCMKEARAALEEAGHTVRLDSKGSLP